MQETRRQILEILRERGEATVEDIVNDLRKRRGDSITAVTVRHHLKHLQQEDNLVSEPQMRHRATPGRPQHIYTLTEKAIAAFPNNYQRLAAGLIDQMQTQLGPDHVNVILEGVADNMAHEASIPQGSLPERLGAVVDYLNQHGYDANWEETADGYLLHTLNCPYHHLTDKTDALCHMDMRLVASLLGVVPRMQSRIAGGENRCSYLIPAQEQEEAQEEA